MLAEARMIAKSGKSGWFFDTGATAHVCDSRAKFTEYHEVNDGTQVTVANNGKASVVGFGTVLLNFTSCKTITLTNVLHVPTISKCLVSYNKLDENGFGLQGFEGTIMFLKKDRYVGKAYRDKGMHRLSLRNNVDHVMGDSRDQNRWINALDVTRDCEENIETDGVLASGSNDFAFLVDAFSFAEKNVIVGNINEVFFNYPVCSISLWHKRLAHTNIKNIEKKCKIKV